MMPNLVRPRARRTRGPAEQLVGPAGTARVVRTPGAAGLAEHDVSGYGGPAKPLASARAAGVGSDVPIGLPPPEPRHVFSDMLSGNAKVGSSERLRHLPVFASGLSMKGRMRFGLVALRSRCRCSISPALCRGRWGDNHSGADKDEGDGHAHGCRLSFEASKSRPRSGAARGTLTGSDGKRRLSQWEPRPSQSGQRPRLGTICTTGRRCIESRLPPQTGVS
jgi:hypothetical protein